MARSQSLEDAIENELETLGPPAANSEPPKTPQKAQQGAPENPISNVPAQPQPERRAEVPPEPSAALSDEPNVAYEQRLYRIFHDAQPVSQEKWNELLGSRREDVYDVQPGDTLWDISRTLFGDGFYWSKLWAENNDLENPHRILKGRAIRFVSGTEESAPQVAVVAALNPNLPSENIRINVHREEKGAAPLYREEADKEFTPEELSSRNIVEVDELVPKPDIPPPKPRRPVLKNLPASFPPLRKPELAKRYDITGFDAGDVNSLTTPATVVPTSFLLDQDVKSFGKIEEIELGEKFASVGQDVFVKVDRPIRIGGRYSALYPKGRIKNSLFGTVGPVIEVGGTVEIVAAVDEKKGVYRATVMTSVNPIRVGSLLSDEALPRASFARRGTRLNIELKVIGGEYDDDRKLIGESSIVYLSGGKDAGLSPGDILPVQARRGQRRSDTKYSEWLKPIGLLKIVKVERTVSTAVIIEARDDIRLGDRTGGALAESLRDIEHSEPEDE